MKSSESIAAIAAALSKAQADITGAKKDSKNPFFKSNYADLASVQDACREALTANELSVVQLPGNDDNGSVVLETVLMHSSGEWISSVFAMRPTKADPQGLGGCLTYLRRYSLASVCGVAQQDDDGNAASKPVKESHKIISITKAQAAELKLKINGDNELMTKVLSAFGIKRVEDLPRNNFNTCMKKLEATNGNAKAS